MYFAFRKQFPIDKGKNRLFRGEVSEMAKFVDAAEEDADDGAGACGRGTNVCAATSDGAADACATGMDSGRGSKGSGRE